MAQRTGLGKGLDALIPGSGGEISSTTGGVMQAPVESIARNPRQPRVQFDAGELHGTTGSEHQSTRHIHIARYSPKA